MSRIESTWGRRVRNIGVSFAVGGVIVWFLLSKIDLRDIPRAIGSIPPWDLAVAFLLYAGSVFLKAVRFRVILRTGIGLRHLFPIVSLYMFFANVLPMRAGELSYVYLLKRQARTPGTKSFASLIIGGIADVVLILVALFVVCWYLRDALAEGIRGSLHALKQRIWELMNSTSLIIVCLILLAAAIISIMFRRGRVERRCGAWRYIPVVKSKVLEVGRELAGVSFDVRLLGIVICSAAIMALRFSAHWYLVRSMGIGIGIWKLSSALLLGVLFSLIPVHGPAGFGTVEAPWVLTLSILDVSLEDAITSGFVLHIIIIVFSVVLGIYGAVDIRVTRFLHRDDPYVIHTQGEDVQS